VTETPDSPGGLRQQAVQRTEFKVQAHEAGRRWLWLRGFVHKDAGKWPGCSETERFQPQMVGQVGANQTACGHSHCTTRRRASCPRASHRCRVTHWGDSMTGGLAYRGTSGDTDPPLPMMWENAKARTHTHIVSSELTQPQYRGPKIRIVS
jgi:hypothetical protein